MAFIWNVTTIPAQAPCDSAPEFVSGPTLTCSGATGSYSISEDPGVENDRWLLDGVVVSYSPDLYLDIEWTMPGMYQLCVEAICTSGQTSPQKCIQIEVYEVHGVDPPPIFVCSPDTFIGGNPPGEYEINLPTPAGCDSVVTLTIAVFPEGRVDLGTIYLCDGDHWELNGKSYADTGSYTVDGSLPFPPWCLREMTFQIKEITDAPVSIHAIPPKGKTGFPKLHPVGIPPGLNETYFWSGPNGFASNSKNIAPPAEGLYCLELSFPFLSDPGQSCTTLLCQDVSMPLPPDTNEDPGPFDPDGKEGMKPWLYPQPATDHFCIGWPGMDLGDATYILYNRWGALIQTGELDHGCVSLIPLPPDVYALYLKLSDGSKWVTSISIL
ncbi:MAG: hypothetical protein K9I85_13890 [Saprospiraceae bacterium]|nr:hypothetical protein [Saprospiraceae bacterium]